MRDYGTLLWGQIAPLLEVQIIHKLAVFAFSEPIKMLTVFHIVDQPVQVNPQTYKRWVGGGGGEWMDATPP